MCSTVRSMAIGFKKQVMSVSAAGKRSLCAEERFTFGPWRPGVRTIESPRGRNTMQAQGHPNRDGIDGVISPTSSEERQWKGTAGLWWRW